MIGLTNVGFPVLNRQMEADYKINADFSKAASPAFPDLIGSTANPDLQANKPNSRCSQGSAHLTLCPIDLRYESASSPTRMLGSKNGNRIFI